MDWGHFFTVHQDLPREGPGTAADVAWACGLADLSRDAVICDAGSGPGGDIPALLGAAPEGRVVALDKHFADVVARRFAKDTRVRGVAHDIGDLAALPEAPFDLIWCAGALYFLGLENGLSTMAGALRPGGVLAFSEPCFFTDTPSDAARGFWEGYETRSQNAITTAIGAAGFDLLGQRPVSDTGWEAYYQPMEARIARLRPDAGPQLSEMLDYCAQEARDWRALRHETGYLLSVVRKP